MARSIIGVFVPGQMRREKIKEFCEIFFEVFACLVFESLGKVDLFVIGINRRRLCYENQWGVLNIAPWKNLL